MITLEKIEKDFPFMKQVYMEVNEGWYPFIYSICAFMSLYWKPEYQILQVKQKFGYLRFYTMSCEEIYNYLEIMEKISANFCELCGYVNEEQDTTVHNGWIWAICQKCHDHMVKKKKSYTIL